MWGSYKPALRHREWQAGILAAKVGLAKDGWPANAQSLFHNRHVPAAMGYPPCRSTAVPSRAAAAAPRSAVAHEARRRGAEHGGAGRAAPARGWRLTAGAFAPAFRTRLESLVVRRDSRWPAGWSRGHAPAAARLKSSSPTSRLLQDLWNCSAPSAHRGGIGDRTISRLLVALTAR